MRLPSNHTTRKMEVSFNFQPFGLHSDLRFKITQFGTAHVKITADGCARKIKGSTSMSLESWIESWIDVRIQCPHMHATFNMHGVCAKAKVPSFTPDDCTIHQK